jgi:hypothetical protein
VLQSNKKKQKRRVKIVMKFLSKIIILFLLTFSVVGLASCTTNETPTLILGEGDWDSHAFHNQVAGYILEHGYDVQFETVLTDTAIMITSLKANDIDISLELWSDNVPTYQEGSDAGDYEVLATNYDDNTQSSEEILKYIQDKDLFFTYLKDEKDHLIGFTLKDDLNSQPKDINLLIQTNQPVQRNQYLKDILKEFRDDFRSLPVIDNQGRFKGDITKSDIIKAIA